MRLSPFEKCVFDITKEIIAIPEKANFYPAILAPGMRLIAPSFADVIPRMFTSARIAEITKLE